MYIATYSKKEGIKFLQVRQEFFSLLGAKLHLFFALLDGAKDGKILKVKPTK